MSRAIFEKPLADLSWSDLQNVVSKGLEEDQTLEFKETLPARDGNADTWQLGQDKIGSYARDTLAKEVVAFANAYGGVIIIGIAETDEKPPRAKDYANPLVRNCIDCVERLGPSLRSLIDPPIAGFDIRAFPKPDCGSGEGLIIIRVGGSTQAPHGVGRPPEAYVRRGSVKEPLTMRDLHNLFWETRTRRERVLQLRAERQQFSVELENKIVSGLLIPSSDGKPLPESRLHTMFLCTVISEDPLGLRGIAAELSRDRNSLSLPSLRRKNGSHVEPLFGWGFPNRGWSPRAHSARAEHCSSVAFGLWTVGDDGMVDVIGFSRPGIKSRLPELFSETAAQALLMAEKLRLRANCPDVPLIIDVQFRHRRGETYYSAVYPDENVQIGQFVAATRLDIPSVHQELEREIWFGLGVPHVGSAELDFDWAFSNYLDE